MEGRDIRARPRREPQPGPLRPNDPGDPSQADPLGQSRPASGAGGHAHGHAHRVTWTRTHRQAPAEPHVCVNTPPHAREGHGHTRPSQRAFIHRGPGLGEREPQRLGVARGPGDATSRGASGEEGKCGREPLPPPHPPTAAL